MLKTNAYPSVLSKTISLLSLVLLTIYTSSYSDGPTGQAGDRTGSPLTAVSCASCHVGEHFNPSTDVQILDEAQNIISSYYPGKSYTVRLSVAATGASTYGFQATALTTNEEVAGSFNPIAGQNLKVSTFRSVNYVEQSTPLQSPIADITWTAPAAGTGSITFYSAGIACNGDGQSAGDGVALKQVILAEDEASATAEKAIFPWRAFQNGSALLIETPLDAHILEYQVFDSQGRMVARLNSPQPSEALYPRACGQVLTLVGLSRSGKNTSQRIAWQ